MLDHLMKIIKKASDAILAEYHKDVPSDIDWKADDSPLTAADQASHEIIKEELAKAFPDIPLMSEEGSETPYEERRHWSRFWCVDPVDGTKEFIKKTGQFTVNIALIENEEPVIGLIYVPAQQLLYYAEKGKGAFKVEEDNFDAPKQIYADHQYTNESGLTIVASRDHAGPTVKKLFEEYPKASTSSMGSSLKFCLIAEGKADLYYRDVPTFEWDTAAAQCIVETAGGYVLTETGQRLTYNKENLLNPYLITIARNGKSWVKVIQRLKG